MQTHACSPVPLLDDETLLERVLAGDKRAWTEFCRRYERLLAGCVLKALRRFGARYSSEDLADLVSEVWVAMLRDDRHKLRAFRPDRGYKLSSWLGLLATNVTIDFLRARTAEAFYLDAAGRLDELLQPERAVGPDAPLAAREQAELARWALNQLEPAEREFVLCCFRDERPPAELAQELGVSLNTIYSRKFKIRAKLERLVGSLDRQAALQSAA